MKQKEKITEILKKGWISYFKLIEMVKSGSADRIVRFIRENPPTGYTIEERPVKYVIDGVKVHCKEFRLCEVQND